MNRRQELRDELALLKQALDLAEVLAISDLIVDEDRVSRLRGKIARVRDHLKANRKEHKRGVSTVRP